MRGLSRIALLAPWLCWAQDGLRPVLGGLPFDSGLALGVEYGKSNLLRTPFSARVKAIGSTKSYEFLEGALRLPGIAPRRMLFVELSARYRNFTEEDFWGIGHKSRSDLRSTYRHEDFNVTAVVGARPRPWIELGAFGGLLRSNTGPGKDEDRPSIEERFTAAEVPGLDRQPRHRHTGGYLRVDYRDNTGDPRSGGYYQVRVTDLATRGGLLHDLRRYDVDLRQLLPSFHPGGTVAARAYMALITKPEGHSVPFYLQPTVGGGGDLRGYHQYRFRDENALAFNLEYRWRFRDPLIAVGFADAGRVFARPGEIGIAGMRGSAGLGGRIRLGEWFVLGADLAWSPDGVRAWFRGSHTF